MARASTPDPLALFHPAVRDWFAASFDDADAAAGARLAGDRARRVDADPRADRQRQDADGVPLVPRSADVRAAARRRAQRCRVLYVSPLKALAVDVERNLRAPLAGIAHVARRARRRVPSCPRSRSAPATRPPAERARFQREPADILITTPESLYLLLTSNAREALRSRRHGHHRRDPRARADQARRAPGAVARAAGRRSAGSRRSASACRRRSGRSTRWRGSSAARRARRATRGRQAAAHAPRTQAPTRRDRAGPRDAEIARRVREPRAARSATGRSRSSTPAPKKRSQLTHRGAGRGHGAARRRPTTSRAGPASQRRTRRAVDLVGDPSAAARADSRASLDADLRQQPAARRAAGRRAQRAGRRDARALASRLARARRSASRSRIC